MIKLEIFDSSKSELWNDFVLKAKNAHFIFHRNYMDYHSDRFDDRSIMFYKNISMYLAINNKNEIYAGVIIFSMNHWTHTQYSQRHINMLSTIATIKNFQN